MKNKLTVFFAGFAVGLLMAFLAIGFAGGSMPGKRTRTTLAFESSTNANAPVQMKRVVIPPPPK
jgi:hypothetical protein